MPALQRHQHLKQHIFLMLTSPQSRKRIREDSRYKDGARKKVAGRSVLWFGVIVLKLKERSQCSYATPTPVGIAGKGTNYCFILKNYIFLICDVSSIYFQSNFDK